MEKIKFHDIYYNATVRCVVNKYIPFKGYIAMNLFGLLLVRKEHEDRLCRQVIRHELIHTKQIKETLYAGFYILYLVFWLYYLAKHRNFRKAYKSIPFEREANSNEDNWYYLSIRKPFNWLKYYA